MHRYYIVDHKLLFLFGYIFYLILPFYVGALNLYHDFPGMELYYKYFSLIPAEKRDLYLLVTLSWLPAFYLGHGCFKLLSPRKTPLQLFPADLTSHGTVYIGVLLTLLLLVFSFSGRNLLFSGYNSDYQAGIRGKMSTLLMVFDFFLLFQLLTKQRLSRILVVSTVVTGLLTLSLGGRIYVIQSFLVFLLYKTSFAPRRWKPLQLVIATVAGYLVASFVGLWRIGIPFNAQNASYSLLAEPMFTWFSTGTFLASNEVPVINIPYNFLTSFINLVPNTLVSLQSYVIPVKGMGYTYENPLGADSVWSTFIINFGIIGSFMFVFITGFALNALRYLSERHRFAAVYYILVCAMIPFQLFRDGFFIINKQLFFNFLIFPALLIFLLKLVQYLHLTLPVREVADKDVGYTATYGLPANPAVQE